MAGLTNFDEVWKRVESKPPSYSSGALCPVNDDISGLERFMQSESEDAVFYSKLSCRLNGCAREKILRAACDEKRHFKKLELEYFLLTGNNFTPSGELKEISGVLSALRAAYIDEKAGAAAYLAASEGTDIDSLKTLYAELSQDETRHSEYMRDIIGCSIGI